MPRRHVVLVPVLPMVSLELFEVVLQIGFVLSLVIVPRNHEGVRILVKPYSLIESDALLGASVPQVARSQFTIRSVLHLAPSGADRRQQQHRSTHLALLKHTLVAHLF